MILSLLSRERLGWLSRWVLYLVGWYVDDSPPAASLIYATTICFWVINGVFFLLMTWLFFTANGHFAEGLGAMLGFGMTVPLLLLGLAILFALLLKWFS